MRNVMNKRFNIRLQPNHNLKISGRQFEENQIPINLKLVSPQSKMEYKEEYSHYPVNLKKDEYPPKFFPILAPEVFSKNSTFFFRSNVRHPSTPPPLPPHFKTLSSPNGEEQLLLPTPTSSSSSEIYFERDSLNFQNSKKLSSSHHHFSNNSYQEELEPSPNNFQFQVMNYPYYRYVNLSCNHKDVNVLKRNSNVLDSHFQDIEHRRRFEGNKRNSS